MKSKEYMMKATPILILSLITGIALGATKPNIVFILSDDVGTGDIKCYYEPSKVTTPNIDKLASQGMRFTQAYAPGAVCSPSRYALLTGSYPCRGPLKDRGVKTKTPLTIDTDMLTLPRFLKQQGYRTAHIGKWHLGFGETGITNWAGEIKPGPNEIGFDYSLGLNNHSDGFKTYVENRRLLWLKKSVTNLPDKPEVSDLTKIRYDDEVDSTLTAKAIEFIKEKPDEPFFVYLALVAVHTHVTPHRNFRGTSEIGQLGDYINELDYHVGEIMATLDKLGLAENTILIFASDNGGQKNDFPGAGKNLNLRDNSMEVAEKAKHAKTVAHTDFGHRTNGDFRGYKASNYEGGHRVPFLIRWPGKIAPETESDRIITLADTLGTVAGLLDRELPETAGVDSFDLSSILLGKKTDGPARTTVIMQTGNGTLAFRDGDWKIISTEKTRWTGGEAQISADSLELYNLAEDPFETTNLADRHPERVEAMRTHLLRLIKAGRSR